MLRFLLGVTRSFHPSICLALNDFCVHVKHHKSAFYSLSSLWYECLTCHPFSEKFRRGTLNRFFPTVGGTKYQPVTPHNVQTDFLIQLFSSSLTTVCCIAPSDFLKSLKLFWRYELLWDKQSYPSSHCFTYIAFVWFSSGFYSSNLVLCHFVPLYIIIF